MSINNLEISHLNQTTENSKVDEEKNIISNRIIDIKKSKYLNIPYFFFCN